MDDLRGSKLHINELANALEVLTNLSYMMRVEVGNPRQILLYLGLFDSQILNLAELVKSEKAATVKRLTRFCWLSSRPLLRRGDFWLPSTTDLNCTSNFAQDEISGRARSRVSRGPRPRTGRGPASSSWRGPGFPMSLLLKSGMSSGLRLVMRLPSWDSASAADPYSRRF